MCVWVCIHSFLGTLRSFPFGHHPRLTRDPHCCYLLLSMSPMSFCCVFRSFGVCCWQLVANTAPNCHSERQQQSVKEQQRKLAQPSASSTTSWVLLSATEASVVETAQANGWHKANSTMCWQPLKWQLTAAGGCWLPFGVADVFAQTPAKQRQEYMANGGHDFNAARLISSLSRRKYKCDSKLCKFTGNFCFCGFLSFRYASAGYMALISQVFATQNSKMYP